MDSHPALVRLKEVQIDAHHRKVAQIAKMIAEFEHLSTELDREIKAEEERSGIHDPAHFAYSTYASAARQRRDNLKTSAAGLRSQLDSARTALNEAIEESNALALERSRQRQAERIDFAGTMPEAVPSDLNKAS